MKSSLALAAVAMTVTLAGCGDDRTEGAKAPAPQPPSNVQAGTAMDRPATDAPVVEAGRAETPTATGTPDFAEVYPDARLDSEPVAAAGSSGPGGMVTFTTPAPPETVIAFYRQRAEAAGLAPMSALNQGDTRGYAAIRQDTGAAVNVVASPVEGADTSVQLTWSAGQ